MRKELSIKNEMYFITIEGNPGEEVFKEDIDKSRILLPILFFQSPNVINNTNWYIKTFLKKKEFRIGKNTLENIVSDRYVNLMAFSIKDNVCNMIVQSIGDMSVSVYMQRILTSYSKYYNSSRNRFGHVFKGPYRMLHINNESDFIKYTDEINSDKSEWSSFGDYKSNNRWGDLLYLDLIQKISKDKKPKTIKNKAGTKK